MRSRPSDRAELAAAFDRAAASYDAMVGLSPGYHAQLAGAAQAVSEALATSTRPPASADPPLVLDLGCGSGASTRALVRALAGGAAPDRDEPATASHPGDERQRNHPLRITGVDASAGMLGQARDKSWPAGVDFVRSDAVEFLRALPDDCVDGVLAAYLVRNVREPDALLTELARVLRPGGVLVVHDYSVAGNPRAQAVWAVICHAVIIPMAAVKRSDVGLHRYLYRSVRRFDSIPALRARLGRAGFGDVAHRTYAGWQDGLVHTLTARRPVS